jgi:flagellar protein FliL
LSIRLDPTLRFAATIAVAHRRIATAVPRSETSKCLICRAFNDAQCDRPAISAGQKLPDPTARRLRQDFLKGLRSRLARGSGSGSGWVQEAAMAHGGTLNADEAADLLPAKGGGRRKIILIAVPLVLLAVGAGLWFTGVLPRLLGLSHEAPKEEQHTEAKPVLPVFVDLPEIIANLNGNPRRPTYVKLQAKLEISRAADEPVVKAAMPRLVDLFQTYLRETRPEELRGSGGTYRLREELIARGNLAVAPARITDVLFVEMLVQ